MHVGRGRVRRWAAPLGIGLLLILSMLQFAPGAQAQKAGDPVELRGFATGTDAHINLLQSGTTRIVDAEVAWSGAAVDADADGLKGAHLNEMNRIVQPDKTGKLAYARGSGLELGVGTTPADENQLQLTGKAEAVSPKKQFVTKTTDLDIDPVARASLLRGTALANSNDSGLVPDVCVLGDDISRGTGYATDVELLDLGGDTNPNGEFDAALVALDDQDARRSVSQSTSHLKLVPGNGPNNFGLMSEVRETIAPVTLLQADPAKPARVLTIEVLGEWVLRVVANGAKSSVFYGPGTVNPQTDVLRIIDSDAAEALTLSLQDLLGNEGLDLGALAPLLNVVVGEDPRAIAKPGQTPDPNSKPSLAADGTSASAAVDVARIQVLSLPDPQAAEIRVGHMEVSAEVPKGGINCPIPVAKSADPDQIKIKEEPDTAHVSITVNNAYDCDLTNTTLTDHISQVKGSPNFSIPASEPTPDSPDVPTGVLSKADVVWSLGTIKKHTTRTVTLDLKSESEGGVLRDIAEAAGKFANCTGQDASGLAISGLDLSGLSVPVDVNIETPVTGAAASRTAATGGALFLGAIALGYVMRRRAARSA